ncbi:hypothetical protein DRF58_17260 [Epilithonimonas hispanica]|uniref:Lipoprotein n=2 Tax=Epilithonimonas hispanica TaxID=358687 RepID=A0A3D9CJU8_9FLAO|nr:hypothetical protein DRF58_17260 [Epilithonimonas hispanica]
MDKRITRSKKNSIMKNFNNVVLLIWGCILFYSCSSKILYPNKYSSVCFYMDSPSTELYIKSESRFVLTYPSSFEKIMGNWEIKKDTLYLKSKFKGSLLDNDSILHKEEKYFIIKGKKLFNPQNQKCFLILKKQIQNPSSAKSPDFVADK